MSNSPTWEGAVRSAARNSERRGGDELSRTAPRVYVNGRFLTQRVTGIQRYAREMLSELDGILGEEAAGTELDWRLVAPPGTTFPALKRIRAQHCGRLAGHAWEQLELPRIARDGLLFSFGSTGPLFKRRQIITVHDASVYRVPEAFSWKFRLWYRFLIARIIQRAERTMVVSPFAAREAVTWFGAKADRLRISSEGWQHMERVEKDASVLRAHGLTAQGYVLAVSSPTPNKNFAVVADAIGHLSDRQFRFVVAGAVDARALVSAPALSDERVTRVGYVSDGQLKSLYENAMCFIFPSKYEGFGIPPLEAMALGCPVVASQIDAVREVCGDAARYFDPRDADALATIINELARSESERARLSSHGRERATLFSWKRSARESLAAILACSQVET